MNASPLLQSSTPAMAYVRVITKRYGGLLGPEFTVAVGDRYYRVGEITMNQLRRGIPAEDLDLLEVDPDTDEAL